MPMPSFDDRYARLRGSRYIGLIRCSSLGQADTSIPDQLKVLETFAETYGLVCAGTVSLEGISGSIPGNRDDLRQLIDRKRQRNDFDVLLVQDTTRLTRGGMRHGNKIEYEFAAAGIEIIYVLEQLLEGPAGEMVRSFQYYAGNEQARSIARNSARGSMSALEQGRLTHARRPPFGTDRLYRALDGKPRYIIRNLTDGTQVKLDPQTREVIERFGRNPKTGRPAHYVKQADETVELVPGDDRAVEAVRLMFRRRLIDGWGGWRTAEELDSLGLPSPSGKQWNKESVKKVLANSIYLGIGIANRVFSGIYVNRESGAPINATTVLKDIADRKRPKVTLRPRKDWMEIPQEAMKEFLPEDLRAAAAEFQAAYWSRRENGLGLPTRSKHVDSPYFLNRMLISRQGRKPMKGKTCGPKGHKTRYYIVSDAERHAVVADPVWRRMVRAVPVEQLVLRLLQKVLLAAPSLRGILRQQIQRRYLGPRASGDNMVVMAARRLKIQQQREFVVENLELLGRDEARQRLSRLKEELEQIERQLATADQTRAWDEDRVEQTVEELVDQLRQSAEILRTLPKAALQRMLSLLVERLEVDLETRAVEVTFRLPAWAIENPGRLGFELCLKQTSSPKGWPEAQNASGIRLAKFRVWLLDDQYLGFGIAA